MERHERGYAELIRWHGALMANVMGSGKKTIKPRDLFLFPDEETQNEKPKLDPHSDEAKRIFEKMQKIANGKNNR